MTAALPAPHPRSLTFGTTSTHAPLAVCRSIPTTQIRRPLRLRIPRLCRRRRGRRFTSSSTAGPPGRCSPFWRTYRLPSCCPRSRWPTGICFVGWWPGATGWPCACGERRPRRRRRSCAEAGRPCGRRPAAGWSWHGTTAERT